MLKVTEKGKALIAKNGGILKILNVGSGYFDYSEYESWSDVHEAWAKDVGGWGLYEGIPKEDNEDEVYSAEESKARLESEFKAAEFETTINEIIHDDDRYGIGVRFGYVDVKAQKKRLNGREIAGILDSSFNGIDTLRYKRRYENGDNRKKMINWVLNNFNTSYDVASRLVKYANNYPEWYGYYKN